MTDRNVQPAELRALLSSSVLSQSAESEKSGSGAALCSYHGRTNKKKETLAGVKLLFALEESRNLLCKCRFRRSRRRKKKKKTQQERMNQTEGRSSSKVQQPRILKSHRNKFVENMLD